MWFDYSSKSHQNILLLNFKFYTEKLQTLSKTYKYLSHTAILAPSLGYASLYLRLPSSSNCRIKASLN